MDEEKQQKKIAYMKRYYIENKERMRQQCREWYNNNKERILEYNERTKDKRRERQRRWCEKKRNELKKLIQNKAIIEVETKKRGRPRIYNDLVIKSKEKKPKKQKTAVIEKKRKLIERSLEEIQKKADAFKISLNIISDAHQSGESEVDKRDQQDVCV